MSEGINLLFKAVTVASVSFILYLLVNLGFSGEIKLRGAITVALGIAIGLLIVKQKK